MNAAYLFGKFGDRMKFPLGWIQCSFQLLIFHVRIAASPAKPTVYCFTDFQREDYATTCICRTTSLGTPPGVLRASRGGEQFPDSGRTGTTFLKSTFQLTRDDKGTDRAIVRCWIVGTRLFEVTKVITIFCKC